VRFLATGFVDLLSRAFIERSLEADLNARVAALVTQTERSLAETLVANWPEQRRARLELVEGNPGFIDFGLSGVDYSALCESVDILVHLNRGDHPNTSESELELRNLGVAREFVEFSRAAPRLERSFWLSHLAVAGDSFSSISETELEIGQNFRNGAERTLALAERVVRESESCPQVRIVRMGYLAGDPSSGELDAESPIAVLIESVLRAGSTLPAGDADHDLRIPLCTVPFVIEVVRRVLDAAPRPRTSLHALGSRAPSPRELLALILGKKLPVADNEADTSSRELFGGLESRWAFRRPRALLDQLGRETRYDTRVFDEIVGELAEPALSDYVERLVEFVRGKLEAPA
jgi:hypothetical protein